MAGEYMFLYRILDIFRQRIHPGEFLLNVLFITLFIIFSMIIYWDTINTKVSNTSRCKRQMDIYNKNKGMYSVLAADKSKDPLYTVEYDTNQLNTNVECSCKPGKYVNHFNNIPVKNMRTNKDVRVDKMCTCDKYYNIGILNENVQYDGEPGLLRYMATNNTEFFDNILYSPYQ